MCGDVGVTTLIPAVLLDVVEVVATHNQRAVHLVRLDDTLDNTSTDADVASERALLVDVLASGGCGGGLEAQTSLAGEAKAGGLDLAPLAGQNALLANEDRRLLLVGFLSLQTTRESKKDKSSGQHVAQKPLLYPTMN